MEKSISKRNYAKASTAKPLGKPPPGDKSLGVYTGICLYLIEDVYKTEEMAPWVATTVASKNHRY